MFQFAFLCRWCLLVYLEETRAPTTETQDTVSIKLFKRLIRKKLNVPRLKLLKQDIHLNSVYSSQFHLLVIQMEFRSPPLFYLQDHVSAGKEKKNTNEENCSVMASQNKDEQTTVSMKSYLFVKMNGIHSWRMSQVELYNRPIFKLHVVKAYNSFI